MTPIPQIKRFVLRALLAAEGLPLREDLLMDACQILAPRPLPSDVRKGLMEMERDGFIQSARDELDAALLTYTLTGKGNHKARQL